jgi:hypothetical protein
MRIAVAGFGLLLGAPACTDGRSVEAPLARSPHRTSEPTPQADRCDRRSIETEVARFVRSWNQANRASIHQLLAPDAILDMSGKREGAGSTAGRFTDLTGWDEIGAFARTQWRLGQQLSFSTLQVVDSSGAYANAMRSTYRDGSSQSYSDAKFVYSCASSTFTHVVLVASAGARQDRAPAGTVETVTTCGGAAPTLRPGDDPARFL